MTSISSTAASTSAQSMSLIQSVTGLNVDVTSLISELVSAEGQPVYSQISNEATSVNTELSGNRAIKQRFIKLSIFFANS